MCSDNRKVFRPLGQAMFPVELYSEFDGSNMAVGSRHVNDPWARDAGSKVIEAIPRQSGARVKKNLRA